MVYTSRRATMKWWDPHTNKIKYCASTEFYKHNNKYGKVWSPGSNQLKVKGTSALLTIKLISFTTPSL